MTIQREAPSNLGVLSGKEKTKEKETGQNSKRGIYTSLPGNNQNGPSREIEKAFKEF